MAGVSNNKIELKQSNYNMKRFLHRLPRYRPIGGKNAKAPAQAASTPTGTVPHYSWPRPLPFRPWRFH